MNCTQIQKATPGKLLVLPCSSILNNIQVARFYKDTDSIQIMDHKTEYAHKYEVAYIQ